MRRGKVRISYEMFEQALHLPDGVSVEHVQIDPDSRTISIYLVGEDGISGLYLVAEGQTIPQVLLDGIIDGRPAALYSKIVSR
jgi:hypothetical protein